MEQHNHAKHSFPVPESGVPSWVDATVSEGWLDLKVRNETNATFQLDFSFDEECLYGCILADRPVPVPELDLSLIHISAAVLPEGYLFQ